MNAITKQELEKVGPDLAGFAKMPGHALLQQ
jgi:hypothetical protein